MSLNIKDRETHKLAQTLAAETGESMTRAVATALRERLARVRRSKKQRAAAEELLRIGHRCATHLKGAPVDHASLLYDEKGIPK